MYQVLGREEDCLDLKMNMLQALIFLKGPCGALLDSYYAILDGKTREVEPLGGIYSQGQVVSWKTR